MKAIIVLDKNAVRVLQSYHVVLKEFFKYLGWPQLQTPAWPADVVLCYEKFPPEFLTWKRSHPRTKFILLTNDSVRAKKTDILRADFLISLTHIKNLEIECETKLQHKTLHYGNRCPDAFARPAVNRAAEPKIFVYGASSPMYYERNQFREYMKPYNKDIVYWPCPALGRQAAHIETASELYKYKYSFTTGFDPIMHQIHGNNPAGNPVRRSKWTPANYTGEHSDRWDWLVTKFFEIMGSGVLLLCCDRGVRAQLQELGFERYIHYLHIDKTNCRQVHEFLMDPENNEMIDTIRETARKRVNNMYTIKVAAHQLVNRLEQAKKKI